MLILTRNLVAISASFDYQFSGVWKRRCFWSHIAQLKWQVLSDALKEEEVKEEEEEEESLRD